MKRQKSAIFPKKIDHKYNGEKNYCKIKDNFHYTGNIEVLQVAYTI